MDKIIQNVFRFQINHGIVRAGGIFNMKNIYLLKYSVKGIKAIDQLVSLSFYKKIFIIKIARNCNFFRVDVSIAYPKYLLYTYFV